MRLGNNLQPAQI